MRLCMQLVNAPEGEKLLKLDPPGGLVGRSTDSALVLAYDSVSRQHAELRHDGRDWWLYQRSQTSATLLDDQLLVASAPRKLGPWGRLQFGRVVIEYRQEALPSTQPPAEPSSSEVTLVLPRRTSVIFPQGLLAQMSPVRVDAPEPAGPPPTLTRLPRVPVPAPPAAAEPGPPPTMIRTNRPPPPPAMDAPPTMIRTNRPPPPAVAGSDSPPTIIRRNQPPPIPSSPVASPATLVRSAPRPVASSGPMAAAQRLASAVAPIVEHQHDLRPAVAPAPPAEFTQMQAECARLRGELDQATAEVAKLRRNEGMLQDAKAALQAQLAALQADQPPAIPPADPDGTGLREKALALLHPFSRSLEQVGEALRKGNPDEARALLRSASFALADLRDLFQS